MSELVFLVIAMWIVFCYFALLWIDQTLKRIADSLAKIAGTNHE